MVDELYLSLRTFFKTSCFQYSFVMSTSSFQIRQKTRGLVCLVVYLADYVKEI